MNKKIFIKEMYKKNKLNFAILLFTAFLNVIINISISVMLQKMLDLSYGSNLNKFYSASISMLLIIFLIMLMIVIDAIIKPIYRRKGMRKYKEYAFKNILNKSISSFSENETSEYISSLTNDLKYIEENYFTSIFDLIIDIFSFLSALTLMFIYNYVLAIVAIVFSLLPFIIAICLGGKLSKYENEISNKNASFVHFIKDSFNGFSTIKSFKAEDKLNHLFEKKDSELENAKVKASRIGWLIQGLGIITNVIAQFGVFFVGGYLCIVKNSITPGIIVAFVQLMNYIVGPLSKIPNTLSKRKAAIPLIEKLANLCINMDEIDKEEVIFENSIKVENLTFSYDEKIILNNINFKFEKNKSYAIVGASGSGKSTLLNLLMGRLEKYEGSIYFDNQDLKNISKSSLAETISLVEQNVFIFDDSIMNNITMYQEVDKDIINDIIIKSGLEKIIKEKKEDYRCGEGGTNLSGGEAQRISIARALLKNSKIMMMDEATSALDNETANKILSQILSLNNITKIIITHRLEKEELSKFDEILVFKNGELVEFGKFDKLVNNNGTFKLLYSLGK